MPTSWSTVRTARARKEFRGALAAAVRKHFTPPERLTISDWADRYRYLSRENAAEPGPWQTSRVEYMREIMDTVVDPHVPKAVLMKSAQVGYTQAVICNGLAYFIHQDPCPILVVQPSEADGEKFSKNKLAPMIRDTPAVRNLVSDPRSRDSDNTILLKRFPGGFLQVTGATSPKGLRRESVRVVFFDEVDGYPESAGPEGDPIALGEMRTVSYWNRKVFLGSTPNTKGISRIEKDYVLGDQREYQVPCPHCGAFQALRWGGRDTAYGIKWEDDKPETAAYLCAHCGTLIEENEKQRIVAAGRWVPRNPDGQHPSWHLNALISPFDGVRWGLLVQRFLNVRHDPTQLKAFVNTVLGEPWEERGDMAKPEQLQTRLERCEAEVPTGVGVLTAAIDCQMDRLELLVVGWGAGEESWRLVHQRILGSPDGASVWERVEAMLVRPYRHESGRQLRIQACAVDTGSFTKTVYAFVRPRQRRNVFAIKGRGEPAAPILGKPSRLSGVRLFPVGTYAAKDSLFARLRIETPGPGYLHFLRQERDGMDRAFFQQYGAEKKVRRRFQGRLVGKYEQIADRPNEAIDLEVYNLAALHYLGHGVMERLRQLADQAALPPETEAETTSAKEKRRAPRQRRGGWVRGGPHSP